MRALALIALLAGCSGLPDSLRPRAPAPEAQAPAAQPELPEEVRAALEDPEEVEETVAEAGRAEALPPAPSTAEDFDTTTEEERAVATAGARAEGAAETRLGETVASLGNPADPGLWLETPLTGAVRPGRLVLGSESVLVELRPSGGAAGSGSRISLPALRLLGASLTDLPTIEVFGR